VLAYGIDSDENAEFIVSEDPATRQSDQLMNWIEVQEIS